MPLKLRGTKTRTSIYSDSLFQMDNRYQYYNIDAWIGFNKSASKLNRQNDDDRLRTLVRFTISA